MKKFVYKQIWMYQSIDPWAVAAEEIANNRHKLLAFFVQAGRVGDKRTKPRVSRTAALCGTF